jgi:acetyl esterase/lipase
MTRFTFDHHLWESAMRALVSVFGAGLFSVLIATSAFAAEPAEIVLWPAGHPEPRVLPDVPEKVELGKDGIARRYNVSNPRLFVYPAGDNRSGAAAIVVPGGGFGVLADGHEGAEACEWLQKLGVTAFLLAHRCPTNKHTEPNAGPVQDLQRSIEIVRQRAADWQLDPKKIGVLGFSAGGQVTLVAATNSRRIPGDAPADVSHRPDFLLLAYPWKIYDEPAKALRADAPLDGPLPPTFITQCADDKGSLAQGSTLLFLELVNRKVPAELHLYERGGHGYGMRPRPMATGPTDWPLRAADWLRQHELVKAD